MATTEKTILPTNLVHDLIEWVEQIDVVPGPATAGFVGTVTWVDPNDIGIERFINIAVDVDAFDAAGELISEFDGVFQHIDEQYVIAPPLAQTRPVSFSGPVEVPANAATLRLMVRDQTVNMPGPVLQISGTFSVTQPPA